MVFKEWEQLLRNSVKKILKKTVALLYKLCSADGGLVFLDAIAW